MLTERLLERSGTDLGASSVFSITWPGATAAVTAQARSPNATALKANPTPVIVRRDLSSSTLPLIEGTPSSTISPSNFLSAAEFSRYVELFSKLTDLANEGEGSDGVELGAIDTARRVLGGIVIGKWHPPRLTWDSGEAVIFYWQNGDTVFAFTVTDGELGFVERQGNILTRRRSSIPVDRNIDFNVLL